MRRQFTALITLSALLTAAPAFAKSSQSFETDVTTQLTGPLKIEVVIGDDLAHRANNLPKKLSDRGNARGLRSGFSGNGFYGEKDLNKLADRLSEKVSWELENDGVTISDTATQTLRLVLVDARPNRPTFNQLSKEPGLSFHSFSTGGASFEGEILSGGQSLGTLSYAYYENDIRDAAFGTGTWSDAKRAISRFADKVSDNLAERDPGKS